MMMNYDHDTIQWQQTHFLLGLFTFSGYFSEAAIRSLAKQHALPGVSDERVMEAVEEWRVQRALMEADWPSAVDSERLDRAYQALERKGVLGIHWCGDTISSGHEQATELADSMNFKGYCFFHEQDITTAINGEGLSIAYDATDIDRDFALEVGSIVADEFSAQGLTVSWSGNLADRIDLPNFAWGRRYNPDIEKTVLRTLEIDI